jgi:large repetitive protein
VYNRSGKIVFTEKGYKNTWDGISNTISGSRKLPVGPYMFVIEFNQDNLKPVQGWLYVNY